MFHMHASQPNITLLSSILHDLSRTEESKECKRKDGSKTAERSSGDRLTCWRELHIFPSCARVMGTAEGTVGPATNAAGVDEVAAAARASSEAVEG